MKRQEIEAMFLKMFKNADNDVQEALFQDLVGNASSEALKGILNNYKEMGILDNLEEGN